MGCFLLSVPRCKSTAPHANPEESTSISNGLLRSGCINTGSSVMRFLSVSNAVCCSSPHVQGTSFFVRLLRGLAKWENPSINAR